jgi:serine/threonine protein kinase
VDIDWWSLGIVAFELVTGWPPFFDKDFEQMCEKILKKPIRFPPKYTISIEAQHLICSFLDRNPNNRLGSRKTGGLGTLQDHVFFSDINWQELENGLVRLSVLLVLYFLQILIVLLIYWLLVYFPQIDASPIRTLVWW